MTSDIVEKAMIRYNVGNPPGKDKSYGDAINWEILMGNIPTGEDIFFISSDKDYKSVLDENRLNPFLYQEWINKKKSNIFFYKTLTEYFKLHLKHIELKTEAQKNELIEQLGRCGTFAGTHSVIAELSRFSSWSEGQIVQLLQAADMNNQVWSIITDPDIKLFYDMILKDNVEKMLEKPELSWILERLGFKKQT